MLVFIWGHYFGIDQLNNVSPYLDHGEPSLLNDVPSQPLQQLHGRPGDVYAERLPSALHAGGCVHGVAEQAVPGHLEAHHPRHAMACVQTRLLEVFIRIL